MLDPVPVTVFPVEVFDHVDVITFPVEVFDTRDQEFPTVPLPDEGVGLIVPLCTSNQVDVTPLIEIPPLEDISPDPISTPELVFIIHVPINIVDPVVSIVVPVNIDHVMIAPVRVHVDEGFFGRSAIFIIVSSVSLFGVGTDICD